MPESDNPVEDKLNASWVDLLSSADEILTPIARLEPDTRSNTFELFRGVREQSGWVRVGIQFSEGHMHFRPGVVKQYE